MDKDEQPPQATTYWEKANTWIALAALLVSVISVFVMANIACRANDIADAQVAIAKNSYAPEFVYLGPAEMIQTDENAIQPDAYYDFGFNPQFAKISGFTENLSCEAHEHYELLVATDESLNDTEFSKIIVDVYGSFWPSLSFDGSHVVIALQETYSKFNISLISNGLEERGYYVEQIKPLCVGCLTYSDVAGEVQSKPFSLDLDKKQELDFGTDNIACCDNAITIEMKWGQPNRGITDEVIESCVEEAARQLQG